VADKQTKISEALDKKVKLTGVSEKLGDMIREIKVFGDKIKIGDPAKRKAGLKSGGRAGLRGGGICKKGMNKKAIGRNS
jgi:hypothetical protein